MLELLDSLLRKAYQFQQLVVFSKPTHEVSHLLSEFGLYYHYFSCLSIAIGLQLVESRTILCENWQWKLSEF